MAPVHVPARGPDHRAESHDAHRPRIPGGVRGRSVHPQMYV